MCAVFHVSHQMTLQTTHNHLYKDATPHTNTSNLLSTSVQAICQNLLEPLRALPACLSELFAHLFLHLWPPNMWLFWPLSTCERLCEGAQSSMKMLCFQLDGLLQRARDPERMIPSVAFQRHTSAFRGQF